MDGQKVEVRTGQFSRWSPMPPPLGPKRAISLPLAECYLAPLHLDMNSFRIFGTSGRAQALGAKTLPFVAPIISWGPIQKAMRNVIDATVRGPEGKTRDRKWTILAEASDANERRNVVIIGKDVYGLTAETSIDGSAPYGRGRLQRERSAGTGSGGGVGSAAEGTHRARRFDRDLRVLARGENKLGARLHYAKVVDRQKFMLQGGRIHPGLQNEVMLLDEPGKAAVFLIMRAWGDDHGSFTEQWRIESPGGTILYEKRTARIYTCPPNNTSRS